MVKRVNFLSSIGRFYSEKPLPFKIAMAAIVFLLFFGTSFIRLDPDFGWHLTTGRYILAHGIPYHDIYTYTARSYRWVDHEWGNDVIQALTYKLGGYFLSAVLFAAIWTAGILLFGWQSKPWLPIIAAIGVQPYAGIRPIAWSFLFFALVFKIIRSKDRRWRYMFPLLFLVWANLHAGFIAGLAVVLYFALMEADLELGALLLASIAMTFINPYGYRLYVEVAHTIFDPAIHKYIIEWSRFFIPSMTWPYVVLWAIGFLYYARANLRKWIEPGPILFAAGLAASRNFPLFIVATIKETSDYLKQIKLKLPRPTMAARLMIATGSVLGLVVLFYTLYTDYYPFNNRYYDYPVKAVAYLKQDKCQGNLFNDYNYGGYLIWKLPQYPVFIDGRMTTWTVYMNEYLDIINHPSTYIQPFKRYDIKCALLRDDRDQELINLLEKNGWKIIIRNNGSVLLMK